MRESKVGIWIKVFFAIILGFIWTMGVISGMASARIDLTPAPLPLERFTSDTNNQPTLPFTYARIITNNVLVYETTAITPVRSLGVGYLWVSLAYSQPISQNNQLWYAINEQEYVRVDQLSIFTPSTFQGVELTGTPERPFAWMVFDMWISLRPGVPAGAGAPLLKRYTLVPILEEQLVGDRFWYRVGPDQWLEQGNLGLVIPSSPPEGVDPNDKWIEINLYEQTLAAYEGEQMVYATLVSSGLPQWRTQQGLFQIWLKTKLGKMSGREGYSDYYYLEDVPWSMYFHESYALHGAYWHDRFGLRHSHGCVNLPPKDARWLFEWATPATSPHLFTLATEEQPGTWVWVHD